MTTPEMIFLWAVPVVFLTFMVVVAWVTYTQAPREDAGTSAKQPVRMGNETLRRAA